MAVELLPSLWVGCNEGLHLFLALICGLHFKMFCDSGTDPFSVLSFVFSSVFSLLCCYFKGYVVSPVV